MYFEMLVLSSRIDFKSRPVETFFREGKRERERRIDCSRIKEGMEILIDASHRTIICGCGLNSNLRIF